MARLHVDVFGEGVPAVFVRGSFGWGQDTFPEQRVLAAERRIVLVDRRGFGQSRFARAEGRRVDIHDLAELLDEVGPAHLVGQSYGAVVSLLAAGLRPTRVLSLVAIEPPAFEVAADDPSASATVANLKPGFERTGEIDAREFVAAWARAEGRTVEQIEAWTGSFSDEDWAAADSSRQERWPATPRSTSPSSRRRRSRRCSCAAPGTPTSSGGRTRDAISRPSA